MTEYVLDASVAVKLLVPEPHSDRAEALMRSGVPLHAPDLVVVEVASVLAKYSRRGLMEPLDAQVRLHQLHSFPVKLKPTTSLMYPALDIALETGRAVYDCCYLALAQLLKASFLTADEKFINGFAGTKYARTAVWLGAI